MSSYALVLIVLWSNISAVPLPASRANQYERAVTTQLSLALFHRLRAQILILFESQSFSWCSNNSWKDVWNDGPVCTPPCRPSQCSAALDVNVVFFHGEVTVAARVGTKIEKKCEMKIYLESSLSSRRFALIIVADYSRELWFANIVRLGSGCHDLLCTFRLASTIELWIAAVQVTSAWEIEARSRIATKNTIHEASFGRVFTNRFLPFILFWILPMMPKFSFSTT